MRRKAVDRTAGLRHNWNACIRFLLELSALAAVGLGVLANTDAGLARVLLAAVTPLMAAGLWGRFIAPKGSNRLEDPTRAGMEVIFVGGATASLATSGATTFATIFRMAAAASLLFDVRVWPARHVTGRYTVTVSIPLPERSAHT